MQADRIAIHQSLHRHAHILGAERELVLSSGLLCLLVGVGGMTWIAGATAATFWMASVFLLRQMAKADPIMSKVWMRHVKQQDYYATLAKAWRRK